MSNPFPIFAISNKSDLEHLLKKFQPMQLNEGETLFKQGDKGDTLYLIEEGSVAVSIKGEKQEQTVATLKSGDIVGEMALVTEEVRSASVKALEPTRLLALTKERFGDILKADPKIALQVIHNICLILAKRLQVTDQMLDKIAQKQCGASSNEIATLRKQLFERWDF